MKETIASWPGRLSDRDPDVRVEACAALAERAVPTTSAILLSSLEDAKPEVRAAAAAALGAVRGPGARWALERAAQDEDAAVAAAVRAALARLDSGEDEPASPRTPAEREYVDPLERARNADPRVRAEAAVDLARNPVPKGTEKLFDLLEDKEPFVRREAAKSLGSMRCGAAFGALTEALGDDFQEVRAAARALARIGGDRVVQELRHAAKTWVPGSSVVLEALEDLDQNVAYIVGDWLEHPYEGVNGVALEWTLRRDFREHRELVEFLADHDEPWLAEAARAVLNRL